MDILCYKDSYLKQCKSKVSEVNDYGVILDQTVFYPGGGGQPSDKGRLKIDNNEFVVKNLKKIDGQIVHVIEGPKPEVGLEVDAIIDWDHRYKLMRTHTALHILCGV
ncbi:MAG: alanine--tRNA ligase-related protein, partial [Dehalococcoidia bacterium]